MYEIGLTGVPVVNVNNNCSTGSTALYQAADAIRGGLADCALAVRFEKMERGSLGFKFTDRATPTDRHMEAMRRLRAPESSPMALEMFGNAGREHMQRYGSTLEHFAWIAWKSHEHSELVTGTDIAQQFVDRCVGDLIAGELAAVDAAKAKW